MAEQALQKQDQRERQAYEIAPLEGSMFFNIAKFEHAWRVASLFAQSTMVPEHFQKNPANCMIALNLAERLRVDPFMLLQVMYIVKGRPGVEGKLIIALINGCGRFTPLKYKMDGIGATKYKVSRPNSCIAYATEKESGELIEGPPVTWQLVEAEGWNKDKAAGVPSKWETMPDMMFRYRAAAFFGRVNCPDVLLGLRQTEEFEDMETVSPRRGVYAAQVGHEGAPLLSEPPDFASQVPPDLRIDVIRFLRWAAEMQKVPEADIQASALRNMPAFLDSVRRWSAQAGQPEPASPPKEAADEPAKETGFQALAVSAKDSDAQTQIAAFWKLKEGNWRERYQATTQADYDAWPRAVQIAWTAKAYNMRTPWPKPTNGTPPAGPPQGTTEGSPQPATQPPTEETNAPESEFGGFPKANGKNGYTPDPEAVEVKRRIDAMKAVDPEMYQEACKATGIRPITLSGLDVVESKFGALLSDQERADG